MVRNRHLSSSLAVTGTFPKLKSSSSSMSFFCISEPDEGYARIQGLDLKTQVAVDLVSYWQVL